MMLYLVGVKMLGAETVSIGLLVAFGTYVSMFWQPIMSLSNFYNNLVTNLTAAERIFDILDTEPDIFDNEDVEELPDIEGSVEFSNVSFTYDRGTPAETKVLEKVSFKVKPGETIALVGPTGAGKTTIVNLISRFYDIEEGMISVDGYDLKREKSQCGNCRFLISCITDHCCLYFPDKIPSEYWMNRKKCSHQLCRQAEDPIDLQDIVRQFITLQQAES